MTEREEENVEFSENITELSELLVFLYEKKLSRYKDD